MSKHPESSIKEKIIQKLMSQNKPLKKFQLFYSIGLNHPGDVEKFEESMKDLEKNNIIFMNKNKKIIHKLTDEYFIGKIYFSPKGFAHISSIDEKSMNYFVAKSNTKTSLHEDKVLALKSKEVIPGKKQEAIVITVLSHSINNIVGTFITQEGQDFGFVVPDDPKINTDIFVPMDKSNGAKPYEKVSVIIEKYPVRNRKPEGYIDEVFGMPCEKGVDTSCVMRTNEIKSQFPPEVLKEASELKLTINEDDLKGRIDFRNELIYTIDGKDAKDLDDAISVKKINEREYEIGVYIADVAHYVKENSDLDKEAFERGTSVYLLNNVIPMLPKVLSNNVCSLNAEGDKLVLAIIMRMNKNGTVIKSTLCEGIIRSKGRLTYEELNSFLNGEESDFGKRYPEISENIKIANEVREILFNKRDKRGSIDFDIYESKIELDEDGNVVNIKQYPRGISNDIIEEFMLLANETVAQKCHELGLPFVYRVHNYPRTEKLSNFKEMMDIYGYEFNYNEKEEHVEPKVLKDFLSKINNDPRKDSFKMNLLRAMQQARYSNELNIHYGLAAEYYCHFTSPIRRYPDLQIHRIIKEYLKGNINEISIEKYRKITELTAKHSSQMERVAEKAEAELEQMKKTEYIMKHKDKTFEGFIKGFNPSGMFIVLDNTIEGYVKEQSFRFDADMYLGKINDLDFKIGDRLKVKPKNINKNTKEIVFEIIEKKEFEVVK